RKAFQRARIEADQAEQFAGTLSRCGRIDAMRDRPIGNDVTDLSAWIERGERILEDHLNAAALFAQRLSPDPGEIDVADTDGAGVGFDQSHDEACDRRFPGTGFADQAERLAAENVEVDVFCRLHAALAAEPSAAADIGLAEADHLHRL